MLFSSKYNLKAIAYMGLIILLGSLHGCDSSTSSFDETLPNIYRLSTQSIPGEGGNINPSSGEFEEDKSIEIEAIPAEGYIFAYWEGDLTGNENPEVINFTSDRSVTAHFIAREYPLTIEIVGEGVVHETLALEDSTAGKSRAWSGSTDTQNLDTENGYALKSGSGPDLANQYSKAGGIKQVYKEKSINDSSITVIELTAEPDDGWYFDRWEGDLTGSENPATITVDQEKEVTAFFRKQDSESFNISLETEGQGIIQLDPEQEDYDEGQEVSVRAVADDGWYFTRWEGSISGDTNPEQLVIDEDKNIKAVFVEIFDPMIEILNQPGNTTAGNSVSPAPEVSVTDTLGNPLQGAEVSVSLNKNSFNDGSTTTLATNKNGIARFSDLVIEKAGSEYILSFETNEEGFPVVESAPFTILPDSGDPSNTEVTVSNSVTSVPNEITIQIHDRFDNRVSGAADQVFLQITGSNPVEPDVVESDQPGMYTAEYTPFNVGEDRIDVDLGDVPVKGSPFFVDIGIGELSSSLSSVRVNPDELVVGEISQGIIEVRDDESNLIGGLKEEDFEITLTGQASGGAVRESEEAGTYLVEIENTVSEEVKLTVSANGVELEDRPEITFEPGAAEEITIITQPKDTRTGQPIEGPPTVKVLDQYGNGVEGVEISVELQGGQDFASGDEVQVTDESGTAVFDNLVINRLRGTFRLTFTSEGIESITTEPFSINFGGL